MEKVLNGNWKISISADEVLEMLDISKRFGWDNRDKIDWSRVNFKILGTLKGGNSKE